MNRLLRTSEVERISGTGVVVTYDEISGIRKLSDLQHDLIILYRHNPKVGHWVGLIIHNKHLIEYFDSYGKIVDQPLEYVPSLYSKTLKGQRMAKILGQDFPWLSQKLLEFLNEDKRNHVIYNEHKYQSLNGFYDSATCGRWVAFRIRHKDIPLYEFQDYWNRIKANMDPDEAIVIKTNEFL